MKASIRVSKIAGQGRVRQQDAVLQGLMPAFHLALGLGMERRPVHMVHGSWLAPRYRRSVCPRHGWGHRSTADATGTARWHCRRRIRACNAERSGQVVTLGRQGQIQRVRPVVRRRGGARRLGMEGAGIIVEHNREVRRNAAMSGGHGEHQAQPQPISLKSMKFGLPRLLRVRGGVAAFRRSGFGWVSGAWSRPWLRADRRCPFPRRSPPTGRC